MSDLSGRQGGLFAALKNLSATLLASGRTRLELLGNELEEEKLRALQLLLMVQGLVFCLSISVFVLILFFTAVFWENRIIVLGATSGILLLVSAGIAIGLKRALHRPRRMFDASLSELEEDIRQLKAAIGQHDDAPAE